MSTGAAPPPLVAVSLKMYLSAAQTRAWVRQVADLVTSRCAYGEVEVAVLPAFPMLESTAATLTTSCVRWGAQDVAASPDGAQTGEVSAEVLAELGCRYVEVGHAERRRLFGEDRDVVLAKLERVVAAGLVPVLCLGEAERQDPRSAARGRRQDLAEELVEELTEALRVVGSVSDDAEVVVAYEPGWAIGAAEAAPADHVASTCAALRQTARDVRPGAVTRVIYGGSAGPGTYSGLRGSVDGLFLGRFAHDPAALLEVIDEVLADVGPWARTS